MSNEPFISLLLNRGQFRALLTIARDHLIRTVKAVPNDKLEWCPLENGDSILELLCAATSYAFVVLQSLDTERELPFTHEDAMRLKTEGRSRSREECLQSLNESIEGLFALLFSLSDEELARPLIPETLILPMQLIGVYRVFVERRAQIKYVQTLYGDFDVH